jgi:2-dehydro-3-deoxygalactonokinase
LNGVAVCLHNPFFKVNARDTMRFVSCDWGTSHFRLRLVGFPESREICTDDGTAKLAGIARTADERATLFRSILQRARGQLDGAHDLPVVISGMASSSIGWKELRYARVPFALDGRDAVREQLDPGVHLISGLRSDTDVLRGEETEALGLAAALGDELPTRAVFVLPGTHSKHLDITDGCIVDFRTYMTGELFDVLGRHRVLRHSLDLDAALDRAAFLDGIKEVERKPLTAALFRVRTRQLLEQRDAPSNASFLSGILIGVELMALIEVDRSIIVDAGERLRLMYATAAEALRLGDRFRTIDSARLAMLGQEVLLRQGASH